MSHIFPRPPTTPPLNRLYYYQDGSTTRLIQTDPLEIERQPTDTTLRWKKSHWSLACWMSRINWPLTLDAWTLQDAPWDPITGLPTLPDTWTTIPFEHGYSAPASAFASPYGHLFACRRRDGSTLPFLLPHVSPAPRYDDSANILKAALGDTFYCYRCTHRHRPDSASLHHCQTTTPTGLDEPAGARHNESFSDQTHYLDDRLRWYTHNQRLTSDMETAWQAFTTWLDSQALDMTVPLITPTELAAAGGLHAYHLRMENWRQTTRAEYRTRDDAIMDRCKALESLVPPPYPIGPPVRTRTLAPPINTCVSTDTHRELARIQAALPQFSCSIDYGAGGLTLTFTQPKPTKTTPHSPSNDMIFWRALQDAFSIRIFSVTCGSKTTYRWLHSVDVIGLDPRFWRRVEFTAKTLICATHPLHFTPLGKSFTADDHQATSCIV